MTRRLVLIAALISALRPLAQVPHPIPAPQSPASPPVVTIDVVVQDRDGHPIHGLKSSDLRVVEDNTPQTIKTFAEHTATVAPPIPPLHLPAGTFTDFMPIPDDSTLNILLLDALNTSPKDQPFVRAQLQQYVKQAKPGTRIAIFALASRLILLQGFTSDPETLKTVVERKLIPRPEVLLSDSVTNTADPNSLSDATIKAGADASAVASIQQFATDRPDVQAPLRTRYTLDAFNQLARHLRTLPGRKNLIWFSGSFPPGIFSGATPNDLADELHQTLSFLARARIAVYPVTIHAATPDHAASEHIIPDRIADTTGAQAIYIASGLTDAVSKVIDAGSAFYTLTYAPSNADFKGEYRSIHIEPQGNLASRNAKLSYHRGYYADNVHIAHPAPPPSPDKNAFSYRIAAMQRGAPMPGEIMFKARVLPNSLDTEDKIAPNNQLNAALSISGPFLVYNVDYVVLGSEFVLPQQPDGSYQGHVEFAATVYDASGKFLNVAGETLNMSLSAENYAHLLKSGLAFHLKVSVPVRADAFLRIGVHDLTTDRFGVIEVPTAAVSHLAPVPPQNPTTPAPK